MNQTLHSAIRSLLSATILGCLVTAASAAPVIITYGTGPGETNTPYTGGTIAPGDTVRLNDGATYSGSPSDNTGSITNNGTLEFNQTSGTLTILNTLSGTGTLSLNGTGGTLQLSGTAPSTRFMPLNMTINANSGSLITATSTVDQSGIGLAIGGQAGIIQLGQSGTGTLNVAGGSVNSHTLIAGQANGVGTINVSNGTLNARTFLTLGGTGGGSGTLNVSGGVVGGSGVANIGNGIYLGRSGSSSGLITITGGTVSSLADLRIGEVGSGTVSLANGYLRANNTYAGSGTTSVGLLSVTSGTADLRGFLYLGGTSSGNSRGTLTVDGGLVVVRGGSLGGQAGTLGTVTVTSGTLIANANGIGNAPSANLTIGGSGTGSVTIHNGGYVAVSGTLSRGASGTLTLNQGGTLQIGGISDNANATRYLVASTGTTGSGTSGVLVGDLDFAGTLKFAQNSNGSSPTSTHNGTLSGAGGLVKTGTGTLSLGGSNSYSGGTTLVAGVVSLNSANAIGSSGIISFGGGTLQSTANNTTDYSSRFSTADNQRYSVDSNGETLTLASNLTSSGGSFAKAGSGTVTLTGANTFASGTVQTGLLQGSAQSLATSGTFGVGGLTELRFNQTTNGSWNGQLVGTGTASKYGAGTLTLAGTTSGTTGTLSVVEGAVRGSTNSIKRDVVNSSQLTFDQTTSGTYSRNISGTGSMLLSNSGTITFSGTSSFSGTATVDGGQLIATKASAMPAKVVNNSSVGFNTGAVGVYTGEISGSGTFIKSGSGTISLMGASSYTGNTAVSAGMLSLADNAQLKFVLGATTGINNKLTGAGTVTLDGDFVIDTTAADGLGSGSWTLEDVGTLTGAYGSTFSVVGFTDAGDNKWTKANGAKTYTFDETTGILTLAQPGYASWINGFFPAETNPAIIGAGADPDFDGIANAIEMVIGGDPKLGMNTALLPTLELVTDPVGSPAIPAGDYLLFTYRRSDISVTGGVTTDCETDTDLAGTWTAATGAPGVVIQVDDNFSFSPPAAADTDRVRVYVPRASNTKHFGRLKVVVP